MERRRMRRKPAFGKRIMVTMLSLVMLLSMLSPGLLAGADETTTDPTVQQTPETPNDQAPAADGQTQLTDRAKTESNFKDSFIDAFMDAYDQQTQNGGEQLGSLALSYIAKYDMLKARVQALDPAAEDYAAQVEALNAEIAALDAAIAASAANGELTDAEVASVRAAAVGSVTASAPAVVPDGAKLTNQTVTAYESEMTFAVTGKLPEGVSLSVRKLDGQLAAFIRSDVLGLGVLPAGYTGAAYDIKLMLDGAEIQPAEAVTLGITASGITSKADVNVYHLPGTSGDAISAVSGSDLHGLTAEKIANVNCYDEGYYAFFTNGFSVYYVSTGNLNAEVEEEVELNEVATGYITQYSALTAKAKLLDPESETYEADQEALGLEAEAVDNAAIASYENGEFDEAQWNVISQASADFYAALFGEEPVEMEEADTLESDLTITQGESGTYTGVTNARRISSTNISPDTDGITLSVSDNRIVVSIGDDVEPGTYTISGQYQNTNYNNRSYSFTVDVLANITAINETINVTVPAGESYTYDFYSTLGTVRPTDTAYTPDVSGANGLQSSYTNGVLTVTVPAGTANDTVGTFVFNCNTDDDGTAQVTLNVTVGDKTPEINPSTISLSGLVNVKQGGSKSLGENASNATSYTVYDLDGYVVENSGITINGRTVYTTSSTPVGSYIVKVNGSTYYKVVVYSTLPSYVLDMYYYSGTTRVYWDVMESTSAAGDSNKIETVELNNTAVTLGDSSGNSSNWSGGQALSTYYGSNLGKVSAPVSKICKITPADGYYVTEVVVACCHRGSSPYGCNTWQADEAFTRSFSVNADGYVTFDLPSNSFGHSSNASNYFILIKVAPLPSPLYVEYDFGIIDETVLPNTWTSTVFGDPDAWTDDYASNVYGNDTSAAGVKTNDTQMQYQYLSSTPENVETWTHTVNDVTEDAKLAAAEKGYYFDGWLAYYYKSCAVSDTDVANRYNYTYSFSDPYSSVPTAYDEGDALAMTTHVRLVAQWKPIKLTVTKTVVGLPSGASTTHDINVNKNGELLQNIDLTVSGSSSTTSSAMSPITAGTYSAKEIDAASSVEVNGTTYYLVGTTYSNPVAVTIDAIKAGTQSDVALTVTNTYSKATPKLKLVKVWKDAAGNVMTDTAAQPDVTLKVTAVDGDTTTEKIYTLNSDNNWTATDDLPAGTITVTETPIAGYTSTISGPATETAKVDDENVIYSVYTATNQLSVTSITLDKIVTGNMGDWNKDFTFTVTIGDKTLGTYTMNHNTPVVTVDNIPIGSTVVITESGNEGYTVTATVDGAEATVTNNAVTISNIDSTHAVVFTNDKDVSIDTGIELNSFPFIMMLSSCIVMAVFFLIGKKRMMF